MKEMRLVAGILVVLGLVTACMPAASVTFEAAEQETDPDPKNTGYAPRFDRYLPFFRQEGGASNLVGLLQQRDSWQLAAVPYPVNTFPTDSDYAPATDRLLVWRSLDGAGPGNLSAGPLSIIDLATQTEQVVVPDNVVSAGWAPNGLDLAYILATPDSYELHWLQANGEDKVLAGHVPHSLRVSPDGRFVAFTRESHYGLETAVPGLYVVEIATGKELQLSTLDRAGYGGLDLFWKPAWSPDGSQLLLYAVADDDRAAVPHESGYIWAAADGSFSHFLPESAFLTLIDEPLSVPENVPCLGGPPLFAPNHLIFLAGECQPMTVGLDMGTAVDFTLDAQTGTIITMHPLSESIVTELLAWEVPGESLLLHQDGEVIIVKTNNKPNQNFSD
jgi:hypothetical protein